MKKDWIAEFFCAMRDCGEDVSIVYGEYKGAAHAQPRWVLLPHDKFDGMSGFGHVLRAQGCRVDALPELRGDQYSFLRAVRGFFAVLPVLGIKRREWRKFDGSRALAFLPAEERVAWKMFTVEQTQAIVAAAKKEGVTVNTYLLFHLDATLASSGLTAAQSRRWMIPVNLRGAVKREVEDSPHMSFIAVDVASDGSPSQLQTQVTGLKQRACHWGSWAALHIGKLVGAKAMRSDIRNRESKQHGWTGIFSNLGIWKVADGGSWIFCPAITRSYPVGAGCVTLNGRMSLSLQLHDGFNESLQTTCRLLEAWTDACLRKPIPEEADHVELPLSATG